MSLNPDNPFIDECAGAALMYDTITARGYDPEMTKERLELFLDEHNLWSEKFGPLTDWLEGELFSESETNAVYGL